MIKPKPKQLAPTPIRLPSDLKDWLRREAGSNHRSLNGEVLVRLEASRTADPGAQKATALGTGHTKSRL